jgi:hypothetical protein
MSSCDGYFRGLESGERKERAVGTNTDRLRFRSDGWRLVDVARATIAVSSEGPAIRGRGWPWQELYPLVRDCGFEPGFLRHNQYSRESTDVTKDVIAVEQRHDARAAADGDDLVPLFG